MSEQAIDAREHPTAAYVARVAIPGVVVGALGALIGAATSKRPGRGALIGAGVGAVLGSGLTAGALYFWAGSAP